MPTGNSWTILYVITDLETGGVPLHLLRLATHVRDRGHAVHVTCLAPPGPVSRQLHDAGIPTTACGARGVWDVGALRRLRAVIRDVRPDIVHALLFHANMSCRAMALIGGLRPDRLICEIQTVEIERRWHLAADRLTQRWCRFVVGNSPSVVAHLARRARIAPHRLVLVQGGINAAAIRDAVPARRADFDLPDEEPLIVWTGRLDPVKGLDDLITAIAQVNRHLPAQLLLVGAGPERERLERLVGASGAADRIHFAGRRDDVPRLLGMADVFAFPSWTEGMPNALLEAMAAALPVVATDVPGNRDVIEHGVSGLLVPPRAPEELATALVKVLRDRSLARRLATAGCASVHAHFDIARTCAAYCDLYARTADSDA